MPMKRFVPAVLLCAILAGCATQPTDIPDNGLISQQAIAEQYRVDREWWKGYGDARLNAMVDHALANNIDLRKSAISVNRALYQANLLGENLVPEFSAGADASVKKNLQKIRQDQRKAEEKNPRPERAPGHILDRCVHICTPFIACIHAYLPSNL